MLRTISLLSLAVLVTLFSTLPVHAQWVQMNGPSGGYIRAITTSGSNFYAAVDSARHGGFGIFRSTNNGGSWSAKNNGLTNTYVWALAIIGTNLFAGTYGGGVFLSTDSGDTWTAANNGLSNTTVQALEVNGSNLFAGTLGGVFLSTNNGTSWDSVTNGDIVCLKAARTNLFAGTYGQGVLISSNNGMSWTEDTTGLTNNNVYAL
ncbi:MAG TPA: regulator, partial [Candidatus Kapabacteria bacterium]